MIFCLRKQEGNRKPSVFTFKRHKTLIMAFLSLSLSVPIAFAKVTPHERLSTFKPYIIEASHIYGVRPEFIEAVILNESAGKVLAKSHKGAIGLMQIHPIHAKTLHFPAGYLKNPKINIFVGTWYLRKMLNLYDGSMVLALAAYNAGPGKVTKFHGVPPYKETRKYIMNVMKTYAELLSRQ